MINNEKDPINSHSVGYDDLTMAQKMNATALWVASMKNKALGFCQMSF
ncbi:hypothetical protein [Helicobacter pylori]|nr:hypothetical protein [Helicobacter pylori]